MPGQNVFQDAALHATDAAAALSLLAPRSRVLRAIVNTFCASAAFVGSTDTVALSLAGETVNSFIGQPLRVDVVIDAAPGERWDSACFALVPTARRDGVYGLRQGRIEISADRRRLIVRGVAPLEEPAARFAIDVGCETALRREYTVLLDPPPVNLPLLDVPAAAVDTAAPSEAVAPTGNPSGVAAASAGASTARAPERPRTAPRVAAREAKPRDERSARTQPKITTAARTPIVRENASGNARLVVKGNDSTIDDAALAALAIPRLKISSELPEWSQLGSSPGLNPGASAVASGAVGAPSAAPDQIAAEIARERRARLAAAPIDEDLPARLEADLIVAKRRLAELQTQLSKTSPQEKTDSTNSENISKSSDSSKKSNANAAKTDGADSSLLLGLTPWLWGVLLALLAAVVALVFVKRRAAQTRAASRGGFDDSDAPSLAPHTTRDQSRARTATNTREQSNATAAPTTTASAPPPEPVEHPPYHPSETASSVDVSELSHVTDEAQVYAELGRADDAIRVLADHIDNHEGERPSPAPWLMMFDLFRQANRREDYERLAPIFRKHFNGRLPEWEGYGNELTLDDGLEAFPHLISRIERDWGTVHVRSFLEELLYDNRGGSRLGFSLAAYRDLLLLMQLHDQMASTGALTNVRGGESPGANDDDGTAKWDLKLDMIEPPKPGEMDEFLATREHEVKRGDGV